MTRYGAEIGHVVYNARTRAFEALVTLHENGDTQRFPCALRLPIETDCSVVRAALVRQARHMRNRHRVPLRSRLDPNRFLAAARPLDAA